MYDPKMGQFVNNIRSIKLPIVRMANSNSFMCRIIDMDCHISLIDDQKKCAKVKKTM